MKITGISFQEYRWPRTKPITNGKHTYTHVDYALVKIATDLGITGIGLGHGGEVERAIIAKLTPMLVGEDPRWPAATTRKARACASWRGRWNRTSRWARAP
jgi:D-arabinonate dehydratase